MRSTVTKMEENLIEKNTFYNNNIKKTMSGEDTKIINSLSSSSDASSYPSLSNSGNYNKINHNNTALSSIFSPINQRFVYIQFPLNKIEQEEYDNNNNYSKNYVTKIIEHKKSPSINHPINRKARVLNRFHSFRLDDKLLERRTDQNFAVNQQDLSNFDSKRNSRSFLNIDQTVKTCQPDNNNKNDDDSDSIESKLATTTEDESSNELNLMINNLKFDFLTLDKFDFELKKKEDENVSVDDSAAITAAVQKNKTVVSNSSCSADSPAPSSSSSSTPSSPYMSHPNNTKTFSISNSSTSSNNSTSSSSSMPRNAANMVLSTLKRSIKRNTLTKKAAQNHNKMMIDSESIEAASSSGNGSSIVTSDVNLYNLPQIKLDETRRGEEYLVNENENDMTIDRDRHDSGFGSSLTRDLK
jgi:hypothetical protein